MRSDDEGLVLSGRAHRGDVAKPVRMDLLVELMGAVRDEHDLIGPHVDGNELAGVSLKVPVARHASRMPAVATGLPSKPTPLLRLSHRADPRLSSLSHSARKVLCPKGRSKWGRGGRL